MHVWPINVSMIMMPGVILNWVQLNLALLKILIWCYAMNQMNAVWILVQLGRVGAVQV